VRGPQRTALSLTTRRRFIALADEAMSEKATSVVVLVFGRRHGEPFHALWRPASKKRQGTKSREVGHWLAASAMEN